MSLLKVKIEEQHKHPPGRITLICATSLEFPNGVKFPFENIMDSFRTLYPNKNLIFNFTIL